MLPSLDRTATGESGPIIAPETAAPSWLLLPFAVNRASPRTKDPGGLFRPAWTLSGPVLGTAPWAPKAPKIVKAPADVTAAMKARVNPLRRLLPRIPLIAPPDCRFSVDSRDN